MKCKFAYLIGIKLNVFINFIEGKLLMQERPTMGSIFLCLMSACLLETMSFINQADLIQIFSEFTTNPNLYESTSIIGMMSTMAGLVGFGLWLIGGYQVLMRTQIDVLNTSLDSPKINY